MMKSYCGVSWPSLWRVTVAVLTCAVSVIPVVAPAQPAGLKEGQAMGSISNKGKTASLAYAYVVGPAKHLTP